ncbi:MAG: ABC transporter permease [Thermoanaerobaculia bacterium]
MVCLLLNVRLGMRLLGKQPGFTAVVVATFALGIGLTGAMFCLVHGASRDLPFEDPGRLIHLGRQIPSRNLLGLEVPLHDFLDWRRRQTSFQGLAGFETASADLASPGQPPERYRAALLTANALDLLRVTPALGRAFLPGEDAADAEPVALLGDRLWQHRFAGDPGILGRSVRINGEPVIVVGVMPKGFRFPIDEDLWLPLRRDPDRIARGEGKPLEVFGRLHNGVSLQQARLDLDAIAGQLAAEHPETNAGTGAVLKPYVEEFVPRQIRALLWTMLGAVFGVLLIAAVNVANLLLARTMVRSKEIAIRLALGASRRQIAAQLLTETFLTAFAGLLGGLAIAALGVEVFRGLIAATDPPFWIQFRIDLPVLLFMAGLTLVAALISGWAPALQASGQKLNAVLKEESQGASGFRMGRLVRALVIGEIAVTLALLSAAGLMIRTVVNLRSIDYGFAPGEIFTARVDLPLRDYPAGGQRRLFFEELRGRLSALPGVRSAALVSALPVTRAGQNRFAVEGRAYVRDSDLPAARQVVVSSGFLGTFSLRPREGRDFGPEDRENSPPVALVNEDLAARFFPGESPVGRRLRLGSGRWAEAWRTIVGVVPNLSPAGPGDPHQEGIYLPLAQSDPFSMSLAVRPAGDALAIAGAVRRQVQSLDPNLPIGPVATLGEVIRRGTWHYGVFGTLFLVFGGTALLLAAVGLAGVMSFSISRRSREIGIRRALGARAVDIWWMILRQAGWQVGAGLILGMGLALFLTRAIRFVLFQAEPWDPWVLLAVMAVLVTTCLAACLIPVGRAVRIDPLAALRQP